MRVTFHLVVLLAVGSLGGGFTLSAASPEFCALSVKINQWDGTPINSTWMELVDSSGQVELRRMVKAEFQICDFKFGPHTLRIGMNECFPLAISNLEVRLGHPVTLDLNMPRCVYGDTMYGSSTGALACFTYFRTTTGDGEPLSQVEVSPKIGIDTALTDSYGRLQGMTSGSREFTFKKPGYSPTTLRVSCPVAGPLEVSVALTQQR